MHRIGQFSKLGQVTIKTLHYYDEVGLLVPEHIDAENGYRYYSTLQLFRLNEIVSLRQMGFSISDISAIVDKRDVSEILDQRKTELNLEKQTATEQLSRLESYIQERKEGQIMNYQAVIKEIPACTVFSATRVIPNYAALCEIMPELGQKVADANPGLKCAEPDYCFNLYLDKEYRDTDINVEICQAVVSRGNDGDGFVFKDMPAVTVASVLHKGPYEKIGSAYAYVMQWVEQRGYRVTGNIRESYIDGVWNKDSEEDWLTELQVPIERA